MYMIDDMIDMGLPKNGSGKRDAHKLVAQKLCIANPQVDNIGDLQEVVEVVKKIPDDKIMEIKYVDIIIEELRLDVSKSIG